MPSYGKEGVRDPCFWLIHQLALKYIENWVLFGEYKKVAFTHHNVNLIDMSRSRTFVLRTVQTKIGYIESRILLPRHILQFIHRQSYETFILEKYWFYCTSPGHFEMESVLTRGCKKIFQARNNLGSCPRLSRKKRTFGRINFVCRICSINRITADAWDVFTWRY